jgi:penicillin amidase
VYDLSNLDNSRFIIATGESGNLLSRHYSDLMDRWRDGQYISIARAEKEVVQARQGTLRLIPAARP